MTASTTNEPGGVPADWDPDTDMWLRSELLDLVEKLHDVWVTPTGRRRSNAAERLQREGELWRDTKAAIQRYCRPRVRLDDEG